MRKFIFIISLLSFYGSINSSIFAVDKSVSEVLLISNSLLEVSFDDGSDNYVTIEPPLESGEKRRVSFYVNGSFGAKSLVNVDVVGENNALAKFLITEFTTKGTKQKQDRVELYATCGGETGGIAIFYNSKILVLQNGYVKKGDFIFFELPEGLPQNKGVVEVRSCASPFSTLMDKVVYGEISDDMTNNGEGWIGPGIDVKFSTTTRSLNRRMDGDGSFMDTDCSSDFYITVTRGATFGQPNNPKTFTSSN